MTQDALFDALTRTRTSANQHACRDCGRPTLHVWTPEPMSIRITIDAAPITRSDALRAVAAGAKAYVKAISKTTTQWHPLNQWTIGNQRLHGLPHHTGHDCTRTYPPAPPPARQPRTASPTSPPF